MRIQTFTPYKSIVETPTTADLPSFTLITGQNGAGKTHLLEAMREMATQFEGGYDAGRPRMLSTADLQSTESWTSQGELREQKVAQLHEGVAQQNTRSRGSENSHELMSAFLAGNGFVTVASLKAAERAANKPIEDWTDADFAKFTPLETARRDLFSVLLADIFFNYQYLQTLNGYKRWRSSEFGESAEWLQQGDFIALHGAAPWNALNEILADVGLSYRYDTPEPSVLPPYPAPRLVDLATEIEVPPTELSTGEKTLLTIALSAYSVGNRRNALEIPVVVLLDEPDAALHPSMVRNLLNLVQRQIVESMGVPVIMTTHSPTTVALADEASIHVMLRSGSPRLRKASKDEALKSLLVGVPALSVRAENRRTVLVESPNDERIYTQAALLLTPGIGSERSLQFMAAGSKELANGCDAVVGLVKRLRENGNDLVWGLVDRDERTAEPDANVIFDPTLHSIENLILNPLSLGLLLVRDQDPTIDAALGSPSYVTFELSRANELITLLSDKIARGGDDRSLATVTYIDGNQLQMESFWLNTRGHDLEGRVRDAFPRLNRHQQHLLDDVVATVWKEHSWAIPNSIARTFRRLLDA